MKVLSLFSGIGAFEKALDNLEIPYELIAYCENDNHVSKSYSVIHNVSETMNLGDITKVDEKALPKDVDLITYGFPCQDISLAGKQKGLFNEDGTQTKSGLFFEALRIIKETQPRVAIAENVKNLTGKKFKQQFKIVLDSLEMAVYNNYWAVLNLKDFGIPQNRERVFIISIRKDIDSGDFAFPEGFPLQLRLKDLLEDDVDERYYLDDSQIKNATINQHAFKSETKQGVKQIANLMPSKTRENPNQGRLYDKEGLCPTLGAMQGGNRQPFIVEDFYKNRPERIYKDVAPTLRADRSGLKVVYEPTLEKCIGGIGEKKSNGGQQYYQQDRVYQGDIALAHPASIPGGSYHYAIEESVGLRIRKLTPKECFRLMGFDDSDFEKAEAVNSNTQLYKQAGNSIGVPVVEHIIKALFECGALKIKKEKEKMELKINPYQAPEQISWNYEELKELLLQKVSHYETIVYTEDQIKDAKADRANLNRLKKALNDERIRREKEYLTSFNVFKAQINEIISIIDKPCAVIDRQVKEFEEQQKQKKFHEIEALWHKLLREDRIPEGICFANLYNEKMLNASVSMKAIQDEFESKLAQIEKDLAVIENLPSYAFEAKEVYTNTLDLAIAISEAHRLREQAEKKAAWEMEQARKQEAAQTEKVFKEAREQAQLKTETASEKQWIGFQALLSVDDAKALKEFFRSRGIQYKSI